MNRALRIANIGTTALFVMITRDLNISIPFVQPATDQINRNHTRFKNLLCAGRALVLLLVSSMILFTATTNAHAQSDDDGDDFEVSSFNIGVGAGNEYGEYGGAFQYPLNENVSLTAGIGATLGEIETYPGYSFGIKYFIESTYIAVQFSQAGYQGQSGSGGRQEEPMYGPSLIGGYVFSINDNLSIDGGIGVYYNINDAGFDTPEEVLPGFQVGLRYYLD